MQNEPSLEDHETRISALEERVKINTGIIHRNRKNQSRTELVIYGIVGFLVMIVIGLKFEDGAFHLPSLLKLSQQLQWRQVSELRLC